MQGYLYIGLLAFFHKLTLCHCESSLFKEVEIDINPDSEKVLYKVPPDLDLHQVPSFSQKDILKVKQAVDEIFVKLSQETIFSAILNVSQNGSQCDEDLTLFIEGLLRGDPSALYMLDAWAKLEPSVLLGRFKWIPDYHQCINFTWGYRPGKNTTYLGQVSWLYFSTNIIPELPAFLPLQIGICIPDSCTPLDIGLKVYAVLQTLGIENKLQIKSVQNVPLEKPPFAASTIAIICIFGVICTLVVIGTLYDIILNERKQNELQDVLSNQDNPVPAVVDVPATGNVNIEDYTPLLNNIEDEQPRPNPTVFGIRIAVSAVCKVLLCFSLIHNVGKLLHVPPAGANNLQVLHGLRFLSMTWVILGHTFAFLISYGLNIDIARDLINRWTFQAILNATVSVDSFFLLSGTLVAYLLMRELDKAGGVTQFGFGWLKFYVHRYWRLTASYALVLAAWSTLYQYTGNGPLWPATNPANPCNETWWTNLLYINNLVDQKKACMGWTWYLANDMQFYVISPLLLIPLYLMWKLGIGLIMLTMLVSLLATGIISTVNHDPFDVLGGVYGQTNVTDKDPFDHLYIVPWTRIGPYLVGLLLGYTLYSTKLQCRMHWGFVMLGWTMAAGTALAMIYGPYNIIKGHLPSNALTAFFNSVHRTAWGASVAWVIFACINGYGSYVNSLLSWRAFVPLSRLTYMAYLVHPAVMFNFYMTRQRFIYVDNFMLIYLFFGHLVMSYAVAFVVSMTIEAPLLALEKVLLKRS